MLEKCFITPKREKIILIVLYVVTLLANIISVFKQEINVDACYYLGVSDLINRGYLPFLDFNLEYTPLSFYIVSTINMVFGRSFEVSMIFTIALLYVNAFIVYQISKKITKNSISALYPPIVYLLLSIMWGSGYELEPIVMFFGLIALNTLESKRNLTIALSGIFCFCSFWSKQYGIGFFVLAIAYYVVESRYTLECLKNIALLSFGFCLGIVISVLTMTVQGVELSAFTTLSGAAYDKRGLSTLMEAYTLIFRILPLLTIAFAICIFRFRQLLYNKYAVVALLAIGGFMFQCYVRFYGHYLLMSIPFCGIIIIAVTDFIKSVRFRNIYVVLLYLTLGIPTYYAAMHCIRAIQSDTKSEQVRISELVKDKIPEGEQQVFVTQPMLYNAYLNDYLPPLIDKYGMSNGFMEHPDEIMALCKDARFCVLDPYWYKNTKRFTPDIVEYLKSHFEFCALNIKGKLEGYVLIRKAT